MPSAREQYLQAMASLTEMTRARAERLASRLARQGELQSGQVGRFAEDLVRRTRRNRETMTRLVQREVKRQLSVLGIATRDEVARLQQRVRALEQAVERPATGAARGGTSSRTGGSRTATSRGSTSRSTSSRGTTSRRTASGGRSGSRSGGGASAGGSGSGSGASDSSRSGGGASGASGGRSGRATRRGSSGSGQEAGQGE